MLQNSKSREVKVMIHLGACVLMENRAIFSAGTVENAEGSSLAGNAERS